MPRFARAALLSVCLLAPTGRAADLPKVVKVELQPLAAQARRVADALDFLGEPLPDAEKKALADAARVEAIQDVLDKHCLAGVRLTAQGQGKPPLVETLP